MEIKFPIEIKECPNCGCQDTMTRLAWLDEVQQDRVGEASKDLFTSAEKMAIPLIDPQRGVGISITGLILHYDVCAKCGTRYCTRAEKQTGPVQMKPPPGGMKGFGSPMGPGDPRLS